MTLNSNKNMVKNNVSDLLVSSIKTIVNRRSTPWVGTMTELNEVILRVMRNQAPENWPGSSSALRVTLNRVINRVRKAGIRVNFTRSTDYSRTRLVEFSVR